MLYKTKLPLSARKDKFVHLMMLFDLIIYQIFVYTRCQGVGRMKILIWQVRKQKGVTLIELADRTHIGKTTLNDYENGKFSPTLRQLETIAKALGVRITDLFESEYK